ncbi:MAG: hypothetical protein EPN49_01575 [Rhodanobacter sp.]|nr:MAG: hypothetical protein EPN49_01575 [Rhodanobacter sp.]
MQVEYQYRSNVEYFRTVIDRQYRQGPWLLRLPVQFGIFGAVLGAYAVATVHTSMVAKAGLFAVILGLMVSIGVWATKQGLMMKFRSRPGFDSEVKLMLSDAGVAFGSSGVQPALDWSTYPSAVRFSDGILLKRPGSIRWLPDSAITAGSAAEATDLTASKTSLRYIKAYNSAQVGQLGS